MERQQFVTENNELMEVRYKIEHISTFATLQHCICNLHFFPHHVFVCVGSYRIIFRSSTFAASYSNFFSVKISHLLQFRHYFDIK